MHSVKNRILLRLKNQTSSHLIRFLVPSTTRDLLVLGGILTIERSSLVALGLVWRNRRRIWHKRRLIMSRRRRTNREVNAWFRWRTDAVDR